MSALHQFARRTREEIRIPVDRDPSIDRLTGLPTRDAGMAALEREIDLVRHSSKRELSLAVLILDDLDATGGRDVNVARDRALRGAATALKQHARRSHDIVFRHGGDELVCVHPFLDLEAGAALVLDAWRAFNEQQLQSFSAGFAELRDGDDATTMVNRACDCLYAGRRKPGRGDWSVAL